MARKAGKGERDVRTTPEFDEEFETKPVQVQKQVTKAVRFLASNPHHPSLQCHRVDGARGVWEAYVSRARYRITFEYAKFGIQLLNNCTHDILPRR